MLFLTNWGASNALWCSSFCFILCTSDKNTDNHSGRKWKNLKCRLYKWPDIKADNIPAWFVRKLNPGVAMIQGHLVNSNTLRTMSIPVGICHNNRTTLIAFNAMWRFLAVSFPFCIAGTRASAAAPNTVMAVLQLREFGSDESRECTPISSPVALHSWFILSNISKSYHFMLCQKYL